MKNENISDQNWFDWHWQIANAISTVEQFEYLLDIRLSDEEKESLALVYDKFPMRITPYYLSLINKDVYQDDPVFKQAFGSVRELEVLDCDYADPLSEELDSPVLGITHRYPDRVLFLVSNTCSMYCRHCTRKRKVGDNNVYLHKGDLLRAINYISAHPEVRDVLISGGDPLMLPDDRLEWIISRIRAIEHVEIIRIGTRMPVVLPFRITEELVLRLKKYHPIYINTHFNHPAELTTEAIHALNLFSDNGFPLGNQSVLLAGVNDNPDIIKELCHKLLKNRVRPYYLYQCDMSEGLNHFRTPIAKGIEIMERMIGHTSGLAVPRFVVDVPNGGGKIPLMPTYLISSTPSKSIFRNYEGLISSYEEPQFYIENESSNLNFKFNLTRENAIGLEKILCKYNDINALVPMGNKRFERRKERL